MLRFIIKTDSLGSQTKPDPTYEQWSNLVGSS
jgi:hypothetical protein